MTPATAAAWSAPTTWCSTGRAASGSPTTAAASRTGANTAALYYAQPDGSKISRQREHFISPNGVGLSPDEKTVYMADTNLGRLWAFDIGEPGVVVQSGFAPGRVVCNLQGYQLLDSLAVEAGGMDTYVKWRGLQNHDDFYTDPTIFQWYEELGEPCSDSQEHGSGAVLQRSLQRRPDHHGVGAGERA